MQLELVKQNQALRKLVRNLQQPRKGFEKEKMQPQ